MYKTRSAENISNSSVRWPCTSCLRRDRIA